MYCRSIGHDYVPLLTILILWLFRRGFCESFDDEPVANLEARDQEVY
jgi:hypothetical protein